MSMEGDWMCAACQHLNFKKRDACQRCSCPKYATTTDVYMYGLNKTEVLAGDWYCSAINCGSHNYASRTSCYRCGALKSDYYGNGAGMIASTGYGYDASACPGWKSGDWICSRGGATSPSTDLAKTNSFGPNHDVVRTTMPVEQNVINARCLGILVSHLPCDSGDDLRENELY
ncbi:hypothetical protein MTR67_053746 [Solanum verrucosum]|uniref:RanBP2-type domain-containing protein n=1 Tax=Solanum verrucosum TaxID=315347 RepID=A0AAF1A281_SOLVR|nr:hypothetical protein MTR67_053746 [Solanum verrucosum]